MAIAGFKCKIFQDVNALVAYAAANATTIYSIVANNSGQYVLFYA